ncbi:MAG: AbrB/MazE/SpoVT family DNA-binding domain-containing protein [Clostridia bacterium]|nr:AbrB/MazE/SpoVT family DNA-binding domain-containing protein [Clostridia bacterium]
MKATGYVMKLDRAGRITLPKSLRRELEIGFLSCLEIFANEDTIVIEKYKQRCYLCNNIEKIKTYKGRHICQDCIEGITNRG